MTTASTKQSSREKFIKALNRRKRQTRWEEIITIWQKEQWLYGLIGLLAGFIVGVAASRMLGNIVVWFADGFWDEALGIALTVIILNQISRKHHFQTRKFLICSQVKKRSNNDARDALDIIWREGWWEDLREYFRDEKGRIALRSVQWANANDMHLVNLKDADLAYSDLQNMIMGLGNFENANFHYANLEKAEMWHSDMQGVSLTGANCKEAHLGGANLYRAFLVHTNLQSAMLSIANLQHATLRESNLQNAMFYKTDLRQADFFRTNLQHAHMVQANLQQAKLRETDMRDVDLCNVSLRNAHLKDVKFDEKTSLPDSQAQRQFPFVDGKPVYDKYWTPKTDMTRYTNPEHPDFWEPDWVKEQHEGNS